MAKIYAVDNREEWGMKPGEDWEVYSSRTDAMFAELQAKSAALPEGELVGYMVTTPHADGQAIYVVGSVKPFSLLHVPYADAWRADAIWERGIRLADVLMMQKRSLARQKAA